MGTRDAATGRCPWAYRAPMRVTVICYGAMRDYLPSNARDNTAVVELGDGALVEQLMDELGAPRRLAAYVLVNEDRADVGRVLREGDAVTLMPPFTGGERPRS
jgi:molybdopterin converting factor small subunit